MYCQQTGDLVDGENGQCPIDIPPGLGKSTCSDYTSSMIKNFFGQLDSNVSSDGSTIACEESVSPAAKVSTPISLFSMGLESPLMKSKILKNCATQASDIHVLLTTLGHAASFPEGDVFLKENEFTKEYAVDSAPSVETRPAPCTRESEPLPTLKNRSHWMDFLHSIFPKVQCSELAHLYDVYGLKATVDILTEHRELLVLNDHILKGGFETQTTIQLSTIQSERSNMKTILDTNESSIITSSRDCPDELLAIDVSSLQSVLSEQFGAQFPSLIKLPRKIIQSIVNEAEFFSEEELLARDVDIARQMEKVDRDGTDGQRVFNQTAKLFPTATDEPPVIKCIGYKVVGSCAPQKLAEMQKTSVASQALTLEEAQHMAQIYIDESVTFDKQVEEIQTKMSRCSRAALQHYRKEISILEKKKLEMRENADTLIQDANIASDNPNSIDLHFMSLKGARKFAKDQIEVRYHPGRKFSIVTGHRNGDSVIRKSILNDLKRMHQKVCIVDCSSNAGEITVTFK